MNKQVIEHAGIPVGIAVPERNGFKFIAVKFHVYELNDRHFPSVAGMRAAIHDVVTRAAESGARPIFPILAVAHAVDRPTSLSLSEAYVAPIGKSDTAIASQFSLHGNADKAALLHTESIELLSKLDLKVPGKTLVTRVDGPADVLFAAYAAVLSAAAGLEIALSVTAVANIPSAEAFE